MKQACKDELVVYLLYFNPAWLAYIPVPDLPTPMVGLLTHDPMMWHPNLTMNMKILKLLNDSGRSDIKM